MVALDQRADFGYLTRSKFWTPIPQLIMAHKVAIDGLGTDIGRLKPVSVVERIQSSFRPITAAIAHRSAWQYWRSGPRVRGVHGNG